LVGEERWKEEYGYQKNSFTENLKRDDLEFRLASKENFLEELSWTDEVHFKGGSTLLLLDVLKEFPEFRNSLAGKTVSGSSAGALFLVDNFYENDVLEIHQGLGIIPINLITHYQSDQYPSISEKLFAKLRKNGQKLDLIRECEYKVYKI